MTEPKRAEALTEAEERVIRTLDHAACDFLVRRLLATLDEARSDLIAVQAQRDAAQEREGRLREALEEIAVGHLTGRQAHDIARAALSASADAPAAKCATCSGKGYVEVRMLGDGLAEPKCEACGGTGDAPAASPGAVTLTTEQIDAIATVCLYLDGVDCPLRVDQACDVLIAMGRAKAAGGERR